MKLRQVGEDRLLEQLLPSLSTFAGVAEGAGDDCAAVKFSGKDQWLLLKTDCVVEGVHFQASTDPIRVGWKAMMRPLSDFAAVSGIPQFALITLIASRKTSLRWVRQLYRGLEQAAGKFRVSIVGGETSSIRGPIVISVSVTGFVEKKRWVSRHGGKSGDDLYVTGRLGGSIRGRHLRFVPRILESRWLTKNFPIHAMMDLSDGLGADLPRLAKASKVGFEIDQESLPLNAGCSIRNAIADGEDFELLFAISPRYRVKLLARWRKNFPKLPLTRIGRFTRKSKIENRKFPRGYVHFK